VQPGTLFAAVRGERADGHAFVQQAVQSGAVAILGDRPDTTQLDGVPYLAVARPREALGIVAHALAGNPSKAMKVIGVTGTNGKSSSVALTNRVLETAGRATASFGTLGYAIGGETFPARHTTPFAEELADMFRRARNSGITHVVMEVSSHALDQGRVAGIEFDVASLTNVTQDHLDYHKDMDAYRRAKLLLFERLQGPGRFAVVNNDDPSAPHFVAATKVPCYTYGAQADCRATCVRVGVGRTAFTAETPWGVAPVEMRLVGLHNVSNALCAIAVCGGLDVPLATITEGIASVERVPGRFEQVNAGQPFQVVVDYAHTEDGVRNVLQAARAICRGRVIAVFGCGGDRDRGKRPLMGAAAAQLADYSVITSDNPRTEDPERIVLDIEVGMQREGRKKGEDYEIVLDRASAIRRGIGMARTGDLVLIAGKGHEDYQILGTERIHFDDLEVARAVLEEL
jgi:UDP-N-acetylmuramoyl-L-alanyl-D-glutamate--2,6-diaminopimelate ligase